MTTFSAKPIDARLLERFGEDAATVGPAALEGSLGACIATSFADEVASITTPTLVVGGIHDAIFTPDALRDGVVAPLSRPRLALLDAGHELPLEQPRELAALLEAFLAGLG